MGVPPFHHKTTQRVLATWLALAVLFWQTLLSAGAIERPMSPVQFGDAGLVICTEHGMQTLPSSDGVPGHSPADHSVPPCPCCLSFAAAGATILPTAIAITAPAWTGRPTPVAHVVSVQPPPVPSGPLQPRAPPVSI